MGTADGPHCTARAALFNQTFYLGGQSANAVGKVAPGNRRANDTESDKLCNYGMLSPNPKEPQSPDSKIEKNISLCGGTVAVAGSGLACGGAIPVLQACSPP